MTISNTTAGVVYKTVGGWLMVNWPIWINVIDTYLGIISAIIGMVVLIWTGKTQLVKYRIEKLKLKRRIDEVEKDRLKEMLRIIDKEDENK